MKLLHLALFDPGLNDLERDLLFEYAGAGFSGELLRDVLVPEDVTLGQLHYIIQRVFCFENKGLRAFRLTPQDFMKETEGTVRGWQKAVGTLFQPFEELEALQKTLEPLSRDEMIRRAGTPFAPLALEEKEKAQELSAAMLLSLGEVPVYESLESFLKRRQQDPETELRVEKKVFAGDLTMEEFFQSIPWSQAANTLLEGLSLAELGPGPLVYHYDFEANWYVLVEQGPSDGEKGSPSCVMAHGLDPREGMGGLHGYANMLRILKEPQGFEKEEQAATKDWAKSLGWTEEAPRPERYFEA